jgi:tRNA-Thr(GGU) m(6)t(6)A37 methyltransferase TsaA
MSESHLSDMQVSNTQEIRPGEVAVTLPPPTDAGLIFIGRISTPWRTRSEAPKQGELDGPVCEIEIFEPWVAALQGLEQFSHAQVIYWLHLSRRDLVLQSPKHDPGRRGTFALRSPVRPNPIGIATVAIVGIDRGIVRIRGLDCVDGTPLIDLKPDRCAFTPAAA